MYRTIARRAKKRGEPLLRSATLSELTGVNPTQVRRDTSQALGAIGKRGGGYAPEPMIRAVNAYLKGREAETRKAAAAERDALLLALEKAS
jgi:NADH/NAD ratio-sensing transcriptional regulator Rex